MNKEKKQKKPLKSRLWKWSKVLLFVGVILITLGALIIAEENWRAERAWKKMQQEIADRGEPLTWAELVGPEVPDDENFAMTPLFRPLTEYEIDYLNPDGSIIYDDPDAVKSVSPDLAVISSEGNDGRIDFEGLRRSFEESEGFDLPENHTTPAGDVLFALQKFDDELDELAQATLRPNFRFIENEEDILAGATLKHLSAIKGWGRVLQLKTATELAMGSSEDALETIQIMFRLTELLEQEPILISQLVNFAMVHMSVNAFWQGWADHQWRQEELAWLQDYFLSRDSRRVIVSTYIGERTISNLMPWEMPAFKTGEEENPSINIFARIIMTQNKVAIYRLYNLMIDDFEQSLDSGTPSFHPGKDYLEIIGIDGYHPYSAMATMLFPAVESAAAKFDRIQVMIDLAATVCALERYWLDNGEYPEGLTALVPDYLSEVPTDLMSGEAFHYNKRDDGWFDLYSVGLNGVDDGGVYLGGQRDGDEIDYPWPLPVPQTGPRLF